ncbi:hypothetical protein BVRB_5g103880 [Beta vulgaris subsp. vulgaris]|nr:hypothetical protein BVRB_5g103880 [Beta vulgaris subsp. vulgaris]
MHSKDGLRCGAWLARIPPKLDTLFTFTLEKVVKKIGHASIS